MNKNSQDQKIINLLKQLPKIEDDIPKEEIYQQIQRKITRTAKTSQPKGRLIPVFSTLLVVIIMIIVIPSFFDSPSFYSNMDHDENGAELMQADFNMEESASLATDTPAEVEKVENQLAIGEDYVRFVIDEVKPETMLVHGAIVEEQMQYVIPVTFLFDNKVDLSERYNELDDYLREEEWKVEENILQGATFDINLMTNEVFLDLPENFSLGDGSARAYVFSDVLAMMFRPLGIEKVIFQQDDLDLGPYGELDELSLPELGPVNYKLYNHPEANRSFLTPVKQPDLSIEEALLNMKIEDNDYYLNHTIPADVDFTIQSGVQSLIIEFSEDTFLINNQQYVTMIESILMTAKSYHYETVIFENPTIDRIGPYELHGPLPVPVAINPIDHLP